MWLTKRNAQSCPFLAAVMFVGVEILNENNHGTKGQNTSDISIPEIQVRTTTEHRFDGITVNLNAPI